MIELPCSIVFWFQVESAQCCSSRAGVCGRVCRSDALHGFVLDHEDRRCAPPFGVFVSSRLVNQSLSMLDCQRFMCEVRTAVLEGDGTRRTRGRAPWLRLSKQCIRLSCSLIVHISHVKCAPPSSKAVGRGGPAGVPQGKSANGSSSSASSSSSPSATMLQLFWTVHSRIAYISPQPVRQRKLLRLIVLIDVCKQR